MVLPSSAPSSGFGRWASALAGLALSLTACPNPEARFDEFLDRTEDERMSAEETGGDGDGDPTGDGDGDGPATLPDMTGTFLFALETSLGPDLPLQFVTTIDMMVNEDGSGGTADLSFQPLSLDQGETLMPREFVGEPLVYEGVEFDADGNYELDMGLVMVTGAANPVTGSDIEATLLVMGGISHVNALCGEITGMLMSPLEFDLAGSSWAAIRLMDDGSDPGALPTEFPYDCENVPPPPDPEVPMFPDVNGTFLFALETSLGPDLPLQFATTVSFTPAADGAGGTADFSFQPLSLDQGETLVPREYIGDPLVYEDIEIDAEGNYDIDMGLVMVAGAANPVTGSDIEATLVVHGEIRNMDQFCGELEGELINPLQFDLSGSTFAAMRLADDGSDPDALPTEFPYKCSML